MALDPRITEATWSKALDVAEPVFAAVAELNGALVGLAHYLYHPSTSRLGRICYLQDLYTAEPHRGFGIGRDLMKHVAAAAMAAGCSRLYWHTMSGNAAARRLYDQIAAYGGAIMYAQELGT